MMFSAERARRIVVIGCTGAGKSTFSAELAHCLSGPYIERDALGILGSENYFSAVNAMLKGNTWVFDGPPYYVDTLVYSAADLVIWLDYSRPLVLWRAIRRSMKRTLRSTKPNGNEAGRFRQWIAPGGPLWAWSTYAERRTEFGALSCRPDLSNLQVLRFTTPLKARLWLRSLCG